MGRKGELLNESEVAKEVDAKLEAAGWVIFKTSQSKSMQKGMRGFPDRVYVRHNVVIFAELKGDQGEIRESQAAFAMKVQPHVGPNVIYLVIWHPLQLQPWMLEPHNEIMTNN